MKVREFRSVAEAAPALLDALAKGGNVARDSLKKMSQDGLLTTKFVAEALQNTLLDLVRATANIPVTVGQAFQNTKTGFAFFVNELNKTYGVTQTFSDLLQQVTKVFIGLGDALASGQVKEFTNNLGIAVGVAGGLATTLYILSVANNAANFSLINYAKNLRIVTGLQAAFNLVVAANPYVLAVAAITGIVTALFSMRKSLVEVSGASVTIGNLIASTFDAIKERVGGAIIFVSDSYKKVYSTLSDVFSSLFNFLSETIAGKLLRKLVDAFTNTIKALVGIGARFAKALGLDELSKSFNDYISELGQDIVIGAVVRDSKLGKSDAANPFATTGGTPSPDPKAAKEAADKLKQMREFSAQYATQIADQQRINALVAEGKSIEEARYKVELDRQLIDARKSGATEKQISDMRAALEVAKQQTDAAKEYEEALKLIQDVEKEVSSDRAKDLEDFAKAKEDFLKPEKFEIGDLFGEASKSAGAFINALQEINERQEEYVKLKEKAKNLGQSTADIDKRQKQAELRGIGSILGATKGFFKEKSAGYKVLSAAEKAFRIFEIAEAVKAFAIKKLFTEEEIALHTAGTATKEGVEAGFTAFTVIQKGIQATASGIAALASSMAGLPFPLNLAAFAATGALLASIGIGLGGGGKSSGATKVNFSANTAAGTGTVLGDRNAQSETLTKSVDRLADIASVDLEFSSQTLNVLKEIAANTGSFNTSLANLNVKIGAEIRNISLPGNFTASQVKTDPNKFSSQFFAALVGETNNFPNTQGKAVGNIFTQQVILPVIKGFEDVAKLAGATTSEINKSLSTTVITGGRFGGEDGGRNLNQLSAEDRTALVNATASTLLDQLTTELLKASPSLAYLRDFQLAGEGLGETIIRVKSDIELANKALFRLGYNSISLQAIVNKQGDIAVEAIKQVTSRAFGQRGLTGIATIISNSFIETGADAEELVSDLTSMSNTMRGLGRTAVDLTSNTLGGAGSFERLKDGFNAIFDDLLSPTERADELAKQVGDKFTKLGLSLPTSNDALKNLIKGLDTTTVAGQTLFGSVVALVPEFLTLQSAIDDIGSTAEEVGTALNDVARDLYSTIVEARSKSLSPTQSVDFLLGQFRDTQALALTQNGQNLANTAGGLNSQINPLLEAIKSVYASGTAAQTLIDEVLGGAKAVADKAAAEGFTYQDESLRLLQVQVNELEAIRVAIQGGTYSPQNIVASAMGNIFSGGNVVPFAKGGAFTNGIVSSPTMFNMGVMGEAGPEAVLPLSRGSDGSLGVRIVGGNSSAGVESKLDESNRQSAALVRLQQEANKRIIEKLSAMEERLSGLESAARLEAAS